jgi:hypothetical protein
MDKIKHVPNHQPDYNYIYIPSGYLYIYTIWFFIYIIIYIPTSSMTISIYRAFAWHATDLLDICMVKSPGWPALWAVFDHHPKQGGHWQLWLYIYNIYICLYMKHNNYIIQKQRLKPRSKNI